MRMPRNDATASTHRVKLWLPSLAVGFAGTHELWGFAHELATLFGHRFQPGYLFIYNYKLDLWIVQFSLAGLFAFYRDLFAATHELWGFAHESATLFGHRFQPGYLFIYNCKLEYWIV